MTVPITDPITPRVRAKLAGIPKRLTASISTLWADTAFRLSSNLAHAQIVYVDTPGVHRSDSGRELNRMMNRAAKSRLEGVDVAVLVIGAHGWDEKDQPALDLVRHAHCPVVLAINKIDRLQDSGKLLPLIDDLRTRHNFAEIVPISARSGDNVDQLEQLILRFLPEQPPHFDAGQITDRSERFLAAEFVREQVFCSYGQEVPYAATVEIETFREEPKHIHIDAVIWVLKRKATRRY